MNEHQHRRTRSISCVDIDGPAEPAAIPTDDIVAASDAPLTVEQAREQLHGLHWERARLDPLETFDGNDDEMAYLSDTIDRLLEIGDLLAAQPTAGAVVHAFIGTAYNLSFPDFCAAIDASEDHYAREKYEELKTAARALQTFGSRFLGLIAAAGPRS